MFFFNYYPVFLLENNLFYLSPIYVRLWIFSKCSFETGLFRSFFFNPAFFKYPSWKNPKSSFWTICRTHICSATYLSPTKYFPSEEWLWFLKIHTLIPDVWILFLMRGCVISCKKISDFVFFPLFHHDRRMMQTVRVNLVWVLSKLETFS